MDGLDRAAARELEWLGDALRDQRRRAGLAGKTVGDSALECADCGEAIPQARRALLPGVQTCVQCQAWREQARRMEGKR